MKKIEFPMSALEIMQACLDYFKRNSDKQENVEKAGLYLEKILRVVNGESEIFSSYDFLELHKFIVTIYAGILEKGKVTKGNWTDNHWKKLLENIEWCYESKESETYVVRRMEK